MATPFDEPPAWVADAVFYQIFPDRFAASPRAHKPANLEPWDSPPTVHGYKGGDLLGIVDHLDHLVDLGVTALYLNPIFRSASNHRYHTHDYYAIDPLLGGDEAFDELLAACHDRGIRIVLDGVFNHASRGFFQFSDIAENHERSPWRDWFHINGYPLRPYLEDVPPSYEAWWNLHALPKFNTDNPDVREFLMGVGEHWIRRGVDGWRLDVPGEITTDGFWEEFRRRVRAVNPEAYLVGEIWYPAPEWTGDRFDGLMHYQLGTAIIAYAAAGRIEHALDHPNEVYDITTPTNAATMAERLTRIFTTYSPATNCGHLVLLDSHDTARVGSILKRDRRSLQLAALLLMSMPGAPCLYYGTEIGITGAHDPDNRRSFLWDEATWNHDLHATWRGLIALRHRTPELRAADIAVRSSGDVLVIEREGAGGTVVVTVNATDAPVMTALETRTEPELLWGHDGVGIADGRCSLPARSGAVWRVR